MNNWRLLLLAVVVVVQPIGSFTESNLIDGRECCERSEDSRFYGYRKFEERRTLDGNRQNSQSNNERRLNLRDGNHDRQYETRRGPILTRSESSSERSEIRSSPDLSRSTEHRFARDQERRHREIREERNRDESKSSMGQIERHSFESRMRDTLDTARTDRLKRDASVTRSERESRNFMSRLPIRTSRSLEERRVSPNTETTITEENIIHSETRRDTRQSVPDRNRDFEHRTREFSNEYRKTDTRANDEVRHMQAQRRSVDQKERNNRESRVYNVELRRQRNTELRNRDRDISRDSERISAERMRNSRDDVRIGRERIEARNDKKTNDRRQNRDESRRLADSTHERTTEERRLGFRQTRIAKSIDMTRNSKQMERRSLSMDKFSLRERTPERNVRDERGTRNSDVRAHSEEKQDTRRTNSRTNVQKSTEEKQVLETRDNSERTHEARRIAVRRIVREPDERRQQRDSRLSMDRTISMLQDVRNTDSKKESRMSRRDVREHSEDRILQRDNTRLSRDRTNSMLHEKREVLDNAVRIEELRRISSNIEMNSRRQLNSRNRLDIRNNIRSDLRRQVLEQSVERAVRMTRSSEEPRDFNHETSRRSRSAEPLSIREATRGTEKDEHRQMRDQDRTVEQRVNLIVAIPQRLDTRRSSRTESMRLERVVRNREDVRETTDQDRTTSQLDARRSSRTESIQREQRVRDRDVVRDNERRVRDNERSSRIISNHLSSDRVLAERRLDNRETSKDSRDVRLMRNRVDVRSERVPAERMQETHETARDSRQVRVTRNPSQVRNKRVLVERRQEDRESTRVLTDARSVRLLVGSRQDSRQIRDSRNIQDETRKQREVRNQRIHGERSQPIQDSRDVREVRMDERLDSRRQRDVTRDSSVRSLQRKSRDAERLTERSSEVRQDRATRKIETEARLVRNVQAADVQRESRNDRNINMPMDKTSNRLTRDTRVAKREERFSHIDAVIFRDNFDKSDESVFNNWQMVFYTLQGVYLCGLLVQMFTENGNKTKKRTFNWWTSANNLIKVD